MTKEKGTAPDGPPASNRLAKFVEGATKADLEELRQDIRVRDNQLRGLRKLESVIASAVGEEAPPVKKKAGRPKGTAGSPSQAPEDLMDKRADVAKFLSNGPRNGRDIIVNVRVQPAQLRQLMDCEFFKETPQGWHLTTAGRSQFF